MEREYLRLERDFDRVLEEYGEDCLDVLQALYHRLLRLRGECGAGRRTGGWRPSTIACVRPRGHTGPHASAWGENPWGPLERFVWGSVEVEGVEVIFRPSKKKFRVDEDGAQRAQFGNWRVYLPLVPHPRFPKERTDEECQSG